MVIANNPYVALRLFFEATIQYPTDLPSSRADLLGLAYAHNSILFNGASPRRLRETASTQGRLIAALWNHLSQPLFRISHNNDISLAILYGVMLQRLAENSHKDPGFENQTAAHVADKLNAHFHKLLTLQDLAAVSQLSATMSLIADYLIYVAFLSWKVGPNEEIASLD